MAKLLITLWPPGPGVRPLPLLVMPLALILVAGGVLVSNPSATGRESALDQPEPARGALRVTRHPVMWGVGLWAAVHLGCFCPNARIGLFHRANALCVSWTGLAEEQAQALIIVECGPEFATADAVARRAVVAQHVQGHAAD